MSGSISPRSLLKNPSRRGIEIIWRLNWGSNLGHMYARQRPYPLYLLWTLKIHYMTVRVNMMAAFRTSWLVIKLFLQLLLFITVDWAFELFHEIDNASIGIICSIG